jgi:hypothetical protein
LDVRSHFRLLILQLRHAVGGLILLMDDVNAYVGDDRVERRNWANVNFSEWGNTLNYYSGIG